MQTRFGASEKIKFPNYTKPRMVTLLGNDSLFQLLNVVQAERDSKHWGKWLGTATRILGKVEPTCSALDTFSASLVGTDVLEAIGASHTSDWWHSLFSKLPKTANIIANAQSSNLLQIMKEVWSSGDSWLPGRPPVPFEGCPTKILEHLVVEIGYESAVSKYGSNIAHGVKNGALYVSLPNDIPAYVLDQIRKYESLWCLALCHADYLKDPEKNESMLIGTRYEFAQLANEAPEDWSKALPMLLLRSHLLGGTVECVTGIEFKHSTHIQDAINSILVGSDRRLRDLAKGIVAISEGFISPQKLLANDVLSYAGNQLDEQSKFPHPLNASSITWLAEKGQEILIYDRIRNAERDFKTYFMEEGRIEEEAVTNRLLTDLEYSFRQVELSVNKIAPQRSPVTEYVSVNRKQVPKSDEHTFGCDLAINITAHIDKIMRFDSAELVQVKKPITDRNGFRRSWSIDIPQLENIIRYSQTAVYWLITIDGNVLVVPARLLYGIVCGATKQQQRTIAVSYVNVRSMAIPLHQFLLDLALGLWLGTSESNTLDFAKGKTGNTKPRNIFEFEVKSLDWH